MGDIFFTQGAERKENAEKRKDFFIL